MSDASHSIITPECRVNRGDGGAFDEAVARARAVYDQIVDGWKDAAEQPTLHLRLEIVRPYRDVGAFEVQVCQHGRWVTRPCDQCSGVAALTPEDEKQ